MTLQYPQRRSRERIPAIRASSWCRSSSPPLNEGAGKESRLSTSSTASTPSACTLNEGAGKESRLLPVILCHNLAFDIPQRRSRERIPAIGFEKTCALPAESKGAASSITLLGMIGIAFLITHSILKVYLHKCIRYGSLQKNESTYHSRRN